MITIEERKIVEDEFYRTTKQNPQYSLAAYKLIYNLVHRIAPDSFAGHSVSDNLSPDELSAAFSQLLPLAFEYAAENDNSLQYTTGQLAAYFGVSTTTINNWLRDKRIIYPGMDDKPSFKQARIPDTAIYKSTNGQETVIREVIREYECKKAAEPRYNEVERMKGLVQTLLAFESKYNGTYEEAEARLGDPSSSEDWTWTRDADEWRYVIREIADER
ncbi:hypothetical protein [Cohnella cellulosilytica]|uniref:Helix-turn-helix domain-containing protein n=1 Tax=Cohnella cellulosilytica TaxID=986710 RepID=A0ABW2F8P9_9BACL